MALYLLGNLVPLCTGSPEQRITMHNVRTSSCPKASPEPRVTCGTLEGSMGTLTPDQGLGEGCPGLLDLMACTYRMRFTLGLPVSKSSFP